MILWNGTVALVLTTVVSIHIGYSRTEMKKSINAQNKIEKDNRLQTAIDVVREQFGFLAIQKGTVLTEGSRNIERSKLIGGHSAGGLEGLK